MDWIRSASRRNRAAVGAFAAVLLAGLSSVSLASAAEAPADPGARNAAFGLSASTAARVRRVGPGLAELGDMPGPGQRMSIRVDAGAASMDLSLWAHDPRRPGYRLLVQGADGVLAEMEPGPARTLRGVVAGAPGSSVAAAMTERGLVARVRFAEGDARSLVGDLWLEPLLRRVDGAGDDEYVLYASTEVVPSMGVCGTEPGAVVQLDDAQRADAAGHAGDGRLVPRGPAWSADRSSAGRPSGPGQDADAPSGDGQDPVPTMFVAEIAFDADFEYYLALGQSVAAVEQRVLETLNLVNLQYESEVQIRHDLTAIIVRAAEPDPYSSTNSSQLLAQFRNEWLTNQQDIPHDVAMLFTGKDIDGSIIGQASTLGGICTPLRYCHGQIECCGSTACATDLIAHELGHLWDGAHCQCSAPPSTMNPSITCSNTFQPVMTRPMIRAHRDSRTCLDIEISPTAPINDICALAIDVGFGTTEFSTAGAFDDGPVTIANCGGGIARDVWFRFVGQGLGFVTIETCGSSFDTKIAVYREGCPADILAHRCNDNAGCPSEPLASRVTFPAAFGFVYLIEVGSADGSAGDGSLTISFEPFEPSCASDLDGDGVVNSNDLGVLLAAFGQVGQGIDGDVNLDGRVDSEDLSFLLGSFGLACQ